MTPAAVLSHIARQSKVALTENSIAAGLGIDRHDADAMAALDRCLADLKDAGDICRWVAKRKAVVTLSSLAAYRFRLKLNTSSTRWVEHGTADEPDRNRYRQTTLASGSTAMIWCETDLSEEPPGILANVPDRRTEVVDDPDFGLARIMAEEERLGLVRPTLPLVGCRPWDSEDWERDHDTNGKPWPGGGLGPQPKGKRAGAGPWACPVCNGRELRAMTSLVTVSVGHNRAARPPAVVDGGEYCCRCCRIWNDDKWPNVRRLPAEPKGKVSA